MAPWRCASGIAAMSVSRRAPSVTQCFAGVARRSASQQECQFEVVHAKPALTADFDESRHPCVPKILRLDGGVV